MVVRHRPGCRQYRTFAGRNENKKHQFSIVVPEGAAPGTAVGAIAVALAMLARVDAGTAGWVAPGYPLAPLTSSGTERVLTSSDNICVQSGHCRSAMTG